MGDSLFHGVQKAGDSLFLALNGGYLEVYIAILR